MTHAAENLPASYRVTASGAVEHRCGSCGVWLPAHNEHFARTRAKGARLGLSSQCLACNAAKAAAWRKANPRAAYQQTVRRRARIAATPGKFTRDDREQLLTQSHHRCACCGMSELLVGHLEADHVVPAGVPGSTNTLDNRQPLCRRCNARKGSQVIDYRQSAARRAA